MKYKYENGPNELNTNKICNNNDFDGNESDNFNQLNNSNNKSQILKKNKRLNNSNTNSDDFYVK